MRIALMCSKRTNEFQMKVIEALLSGNRHEACLCLIDARQEEELFKKTIRNLKRGRGGYIIVMALKSRKKKAAISFDTEGIMKEKNVPVIFLTDFYSSGIKDAVGARSPEVMCLVGGFGIVKEPLISICPQGILSYHHGDMRRYRGMPPGFWELYNGESEMGVTVQRLSKGLDCGTPIIEKTIPILPSDDLDSLTSRAFSESRTMMREAVDIISRPDYKEQKLECYGSVYTAPNLRQYLRMKSRVSKRQKAKRPAEKGTV